MNFVAGKNLVGDSEITCPYCDKLNGMNKTILSPKHLKADHGKILLDIRSEFPDHVTMTKNYYDKMKERQNESKGKTKIIKCCNCSNEFEGNINLSNKFTLCKACKKNGVKDELGIKRHKNMIKTLQKTYGDNITNVSHIKDVVNKRNDTVSKKSNDPNYFKDIVNKRNNTLEEKYGPDYKKILNEKSKKGMNNIYGVDHPLQNPDSLNKFKDTCSKKFGTNTPFQNENVKDKIKNTNLLKRGVTNVMQDTEVSSKVSKSLVESWKDDDVRKTRHDAYYKPFVERMIKYLEESSKIKLLDKEYKNAHYKHRWKCIKCEFEFEQIWNSIQQGYLCPNCRPKTRSNSSIAQKEIEEFIISLGLEILVSNRCIIAPYELDIVIPELKIAIEYNGLYWHNEEIIKNTRKNFNNPKLFHSYKTDECIKMGYKLITIFEDEWIFKQDIVKSRLKRILNVKTNKRIHARKCNIVEISKEDKNKFLDKFHIQGKRDNSCLYIGAIYDDEIISIMTFGKPNISKGYKNSKEHIWELTRYCSNPEYYSPGLASRLLKYFKNKYNWIQIFSYADRRWSSGDLYKNLGFDLSHITSPNYWYVHPSKSFKRIHRFQLRKTKDEPKDISERNIRISQGYLIVWDCGSLKFILENKD